MVSGVSNSRLALIDELIRIRQEQGISQKKLDELRYRAEGAGPIGQDTGGCAD